jgi:THO complex subunit 4
MELFGEVGNIKYASVHYDRSGRSMGKADVVFDRRVDAQAAIQQYDGVPLDGRPMSITWANPPPATQQVSPRGSGLRQIQGKRINRPAAKGGSFRGGRGRGRGGSRGGRQTTKQPTAEELDAELDAYVSQNQK